MKSVQMIRKVSGPYNLNTYFLSCKKTGETVVIDPGGQADAVISLLEQNNLKPIRLLLTHGHADQFFCVPEFKKKYDIPFCIHDEDDRFFKDKQVQKQTYQAVRLPAPYPADIKLYHKDEIQVGGSIVRVIHTPGHTPGSSCFLCEDHLFTGDAIFVGEAGRTDLPGGDLELLIQSIQTRILPLDKKTIILPGHHHTGTAVQSTIEEELKTNIYITDFILDT